MASVVELMVPEVRVLRIYVVAMPAFCTSSSSRLDGKAAQAALHASGIHPML